MPDLSYEASAKYWFEYVDPMIYRVITFMESVEDWTLDGNPEFEQAMEQLGKELDDIEKIDMGLLAEEDKFIRIVGNIKSGRGLRLLQAIDTLIALVLAFRYHFWYFQMKQHKLGCTFNEWYRQGLLGEKK